MIILRQRTYTLLDEKGGDGRGVSATAVQQAYKDAGGKEKTGLSLIEFAHGKNWKPTDGKTRRQDGTVVQTHPGEGGYVKDLSSKIGQVSQQRADQRKANQEFVKANPNAFKNVATKARTQGYNAGVKAGQSQVGLKQGAINTWKGMNNTQKGLAIGTAAAATLGTGMMIARNRRKRKEAERELELERARNRR
jgi:hypothetical protein